MTCKTQSESQDFTQKHLLSPLLLSHILSSRQEHALLYSALLTRLFSTLPLLYLCSTSTFSTSRGCPLDTMIFGLVRIEPFGTRSFLQWNFLWSCIQTYIHIYIYIMYICIDIYIYILYYIISYYIILYYIIYILCIYSAHNMCISNSASSRNHHVRVRSAFLQAQYSHFLLDSRGALAAAHHEKLSRPTLNNRTHPKPGYSSHTQRWGLSVSLDLVVSIRTMAIGTCWWSKFGSPSL